MLAIKVGAYTPPAGVGVAVGPASVAGVGVFVGVFVGVGDGALTVMENCADSLLTPELSILACTQYVLV